MMNSIKFILLQEQAGVHGMAHQTPAVMPMLHLHTLPILMQVMVVKEMSRLDINDCCIAALLSTDK